LAWWFVNPVSVIYIALGGQDEALILLTVCVSLWLVYSNRDAMGGGTAVFGFVFTKLLSGIALVPWLAFPLRRTRRAWVVTGIGVVLIAVISWLTPIQIIGAAREIGRTSAGNLWTLAAEILGPDYRVDGSWSYTVYPLLLIPVLWWCIRSPWELGSQILRLWALFGVLFMILSPKTYGMYVVMFLPAAIWLCNTMPRRVGTLYGVVFWPLVVIEQTLWFHVGKEAVIYQASELRMLMITVDVLLVCGNIGLVTQGLRRAEPARIGHSSGR
jgi:hypothetical protein